MVTIRLSQINYLSPFFVGRGSIVRPNFLPEIFFNMPLIWKIDNFRVLLTCSLFIELWLKRQNANLESKSSWVQALRVQLPPNRPFHSFGALASGDLQIWCTYFRNVVLLINLSDQRKLRRRHPNWLRIFRHSRRGCRRRGWADSRDWRRRRQKRGCWETRRRRGLPGASGVPANLHSLRIRRSKSPCLHGICEKMDHGESGNRSRYLNLIDGQFQK